MLGCGDGDVGECPGVGYGALVIIVRNALVAVVVYEIARGIATVAPQREEVVLRLKASWAFGAVVR